MSGASGFSDDDAAKLAQVLSDQLRRGALEVPELGEGEVDYTSRCIQPVITALIARLGIVGLLQAGDGAAPVPPVPFLGRFFYPDATLTYRDQALVACEVKLLRDSRVQYALATAVGQVSIYRDAGYPHGLLILIDMTGTLSDDAIAAATRGFEEAGLLHLVVRKPGRRGLQPHPIPPH
jgi:hypothetical protein